MGTLFSSDSSKKRFFSYHIVAILDIYQDHGIFKFLCSNAKLIFQQLIDCISNGIFMGWHKNIAAKPGFCELISVYIPVYQSFGKFFISKMFYISWYWLYKKNIWFSSVMRIFSITNAVFLERQKNINIA